MDCHDDLMDFQDGQEVLMARWFLALGTDLTGHWHEACLGGWFVADVGSDGTRTRLSSVPSSPVRGAFIFDVALPLALRMKVLSLLKTLISA